LETYKDDLECENIITELISNPNKLESMSKKARKYAEENFSWKIIAEKIIDFD